MRAEYEPRRETYLAASPEELRARTPTGRAAGMVNQAMRFPHQGTLTVGQDTLTLDGYRTLTPGEIASVEQTFIPEYGRLAAGGVRGGFPSLGFIRRQGAPLVVHLKTGERIVMLLGFEPISGTTKNREWVDTLKEFAQRG